MREDVFLRWLANPSRPCLVMGVLNVTPDSFSDGGRFADPSAAVEQAFRMCEQGADLVDIGGESTRPGAQRVSAEEQIRRVRPVIEKLAGELPAVLSIDTTRSAVARAALDAGASVINDISAGRDDMEMFRLASERKAPIILMHMLGEPATMQSDPIYADVVKEVRSFLMERVERALSAGIGNDRILIDPGIGFGKTLEHNLELLKNLRDLCGLNHPVVVGTSRKSFIGRVTGEAEPAGRLFGSAASVAWSAANGAGIVRVHDVEPMAKVVKMIRAIQTGRA